jgi:tetratricopeptide (TPR) repeat protein
VPEGQLRNLAEQLEEFHSVLSQVLTKDFFDPHTPTVILVFNNDEEYAPFKPLYRGQPKQFVAGSLNSTPDVNYITLLAQSSREGTASLAFHEYVHALVKNRYGRAPVWFDEGIAEYYRGYDLGDDKRRVRLGMRQLGRMRFLRGHKLLPLGQLLTADRQSSLYNEHDENGIFYAQSWALVHYLLGDNTGERQRQLSQFLILMAGGVSVEEGVRQAFKTDLTTFEGRVRDYVREAHYPARVERLGSRLAPSTAMEAFPLSEAETQSYLGDLLLRADRLEEARTYLQQSLTLDPGLASAQISLGILCLREGNIADSKKLLLKAIGASPQSHLAHYYYAELLRREGSDSDNTVAGYEQRTALIRAELKKAIELAPDFLNAYGLLALVDIERGPRTDEAADLLNRGMALAPERSELKLLMAQLHLRNEQFTAARDLLNTVIRDAPANLPVRTEAQEILDSVSIKERAVAERREQDETAQKAAAGHDDLQPCDMPLPGPQLKPVRFTGQQVCGLLVRVECSDEGVLLFVKAGERLIKLHGDALKRIRFVTYTSKVRGIVECGEQHSAQPVLVTYRPSGEGGQLNDGEVIAVEFVPEDWIH